MEYSTLTIQDKIAGLKNRIRSLEEEHYSNSVFAFEAELVGSTKELQEFTFANTLIEKRINGLEEKARVLSESLKNSESEEDGGTV